jgi:hypothetical protein
LDLLRLELLRMEPVLGRSSPLLSLSLLVDGASRMSGVVAREVSCSAAMAPLHREQRRTGFRTPSSSFPSYFKRRLNN